MALTINENREKLKQLERAFIGAVSSALNYDSKEWVFNDKGRLHAVSTSYLNGNDNHENGAITLALARYQSNYFEPVSLKLPTSSINTTVEGEAIYCEYNEKTGSFFVPSKKQIRERDYGDPATNKELSESVENTHFNSSLYVSTRESNKLNPEQTLHLVFRGTEQKLDSIVGKYGIDAYTDLDKYYRQMEVFEKAIFKHIEENPSIKEFSITGHSLGGAMAQFFHEKHKDYFEKKGIKFYATTFGSPGSDMKPLFSDIKDRYRSFRVLLSNMTEMNAFNADYVESMTTQFLQESQKQFMNTDESLLSKPSEFVMLASAATSAMIARIYASISNKVQEVFHYNRVKEENLFRNNDSVENKKKYDQQHYFHKNDPIPKVGSLGYNKNGEVIEVYNHISKQRGAGKFFKGIMSEHTSDGYIHNIVNEIQKIYMQNPELKSEMFKLNPAFREYVEGYNTLVNKKEEFKELLKAHPELKEELESNMFNGAKNNRNKVITMAGSISQYKRSQEQTQELMSQISEGSAKYLRQIKPVFENTEPKINGMAPTKDYSDGILPIPSGHKITTIQKVIDDKYKITLIVDQSFKITNDVVNTNSGVKIKHELDVSREQIEKKLGKVTDSYQLLEKTAIHHHKSSFTKDAVYCVASCCSAEDVNKTILQKITTYSAKGKLENYLFENTGGSCDLQPDLDLSKYNVSAVQSFHTDYTGDKLTISELIADKLGFAKKSPQIDRVISEASHVAKHGASKKEIQEFSKELDSFLKKPDVLEAMKKVTTQREQEELDDLRIRHTRKLEI